MGITLADRVYFGATWAPLDKAQGAPIALGGGFAHARVIRSVTGDFFAGVVEKLDRGGQVVDVVLAFGGVDLGTLPGALLVAGVPVPQAAEAAVLYDALWSDPRYAGAAIHVTGHSLGAGLTQYLAAHSLATYGAAPTVARADFLGFGSPSWGAVAARYHGLDARALDGRYQDYTAANDPVLVNGIERTGTTHYLPAYTLGLPGVNEVSAHHAYTYIAALGLPDWLGSAGAQAAIDGIAGSSTMPFDRAYGPEGATPMTVRGDTADNVLRGMGGDDVIVGGAGIDKLFGGAGADVFRFEEVGDSGVAKATADRIKDFAPGDRIDLSAIDAVAGGLLGGLTNEAFAFVGTAAFTAAGQLRSWTHGAATFIAGDVDGDRAADFLIVLDGAHQLAASDLIL